MLRTLVVSLVLQLVNELVLRRGQFLKRVVAAAFEERCRPSRRVRLHLPAPLKLPIQGGDRHRPEASRLDQACHLSGRYIFKFFLAYSGRGSLLSLVLVLG